MVGPAGVMRHSFKKSLKKSHEVEDLPIWEEIYKKAFPNIAVMVNHRQDGFHQRAGVDRSVILNNSKQILIDEKARFRNEITGKVYTDIALEYFSDTDRKTPGWVCKPLQADYICYAICPLGKAYLLPVIELQKAWGKNGNDWIQKFPKIESFNEENGNYWTTTSVGVPPEILFPKIGNELRICFEPYEPIEDLPF